MGEKEDERLFAGKGNDDCTTISVRLCGVSARTQPCGCHLASSKSVTQGRHVVGSTEFPVQESIENEFPIVKEIQETRVPTKDSHRLDDGALNGLKNDVLSRDQNRTPDAKGKVVDQSFHNNCQRSVISRIAEKGLSQSHEPKRKFRFYCITPKPFASNSNSKSLKKITAYEPFVASTGGCGSVCGVNDSSHIGADKTDLKLPCSGCERTSLISDETSSVEHTDHTSELSNATILSRKPSVSESNPHNETEGHKKRDSTGRSLVESANCYACAVHTHPQTLGESANIEVLPVRTCAESENSTVYQPATAEGLLNCAHISYPTQANEKSADQDERRDLRTSTTEMGNSPPRSEREEITEYTAKSKQTDNSTTPCDNLGVNSGVDKRNAPVCKIPELIVSDSAADQELRLPSVQELDQGSSNGKPELRVHKSSDSAYSSDSRCTSMDSSSYPANRSEDTDDGDQDRNSLLSPPNKTVDSKSLSSSSSSSSSSPSHATLPGNSSDSTLRVISEYGLQRKLSSSSGSSFRSSLSFEESEDDMLSSDGELRDQMSSRGRRQSKAQSSWTKIRRMVIWSPFMQSFKKKYPWVQLAGHAGNFQPGEEGCILKKYCAREAECLSKITNDTHLKSYAPHYHGVVDKDGERYTRMQDLLLAYDCPSVMDCKMGVRTYLEDELVKAKIKPRLRHDMYKKMTEISPEEPTPEEHEAKAVTKPRYMQWREHVSSSSNLGFRIEGIKKGENEPSKDYKLTKTKEQVKKAFKYFIDNKFDVLRKYIERLKDIRDAAEKSDFFMTHEVIGSSLLFVHDHTGIASSWMIDFGKTTQLSENKRLTHREEWVEGNREDGYLFGLDNLIGIFEEIERELEAGPAKDENWVEKSNELLTDTYSNTAWSLFSQSSGESFESTALESPTITISDVSFDGSSPRKPPLKRQVAATDSYDYCPSPNGDTTESLNHSVAEFAEDTNHFVGQDVAATNHSGVHQGGATNHCLNENVDDSSSLEEVPSKETMSNSKT